MSGGRLVVLDRLGREVKRFPLVSGLATLGSDPACDIRVMLPTVSPHHATVVVHANQTVVRNVCGGETLVNGRCVSVAALRHGDVISVGGRHLRWEYNDVHAARPQAPQPALAVSGRKSRVVRRGSGPASGPARERALQLAIEMSHRASMPGSTGGKQVAIVQPQRRDTNEYTDNKTPPRTTQSNKRARTSKSDLDTSTTEVDSEKTKRKSQARVSTKSPPSNLHNTTKATLWIESRKTSPRNSSKVHTPTPQHVLRVRRNTVSAKKSTPLRLTVLKRVQSAKKMKVTKIEAPLKIDHTKQAALLLMTGRTPKSSVSSANSTPNTSGRSVSLLVRKSGRPSRTKRLSHTPRTSRASRTDNTVTILEITDSDSRNSSLRTSTASRRSGQKSPKKSPAPTSPRKSALKDPSAKRGTRKTESIKFDLSNLENHSQDTDVIMVTDSSKPSYEGDSVSEDMTLHYSSSSCGQSPSPSARRSIHCRSARMLQQSVGSPVTSPCRTLTPRPPGSPSPRRSVRGSLLVQKALHNTQTSDQSHLTTAVSDNSNSTVNSAFRTRTLTPRTPRNDLESYSIVDLVSFDAEDTARSASVYDSAGSSDSTAFGTPQTTAGRKTRSTMDPTLVGSSTPYVKNTRRSLTPKSNSSSNVSRKSSINRSQSTRSSTGSQQSKTMSTPENTEDVKKHISVNSTKISRASRSRSRINDSDLLLVEDDDESPRTSKRVTTSKSTRSSVNSGAVNNNSLLSTPTHSPAQNEGTSTPENRHSPEEVSTPVLSIQSLLDSSQGSLTSQKSTKRGRNSFNAKRKTTGGVTGPKFRVGTKSKSMNFSARKTRLRLSSESVEASNKTGDGSQDGEIVTPKSAFKLVQEGVKNKHSTAKKPQSKRSIIDDLNESDIVKQLFNSPVKRKLSQSMSEFSRRQLFEDDEDVVQAKRPTRNTVALTGRTPDNSLLDRTESYTPDLFVSPISTPTNSPNLNGIKMLFDKNTPENDLRNVRGVKALLRTPRTRRSIKNDLTNVSGVKTVFAMSPKNRLSDVRIKEVFASSPKNDLRRVSGVKSLFQSEKKRKSPRNELDDVRGVKKLFKAKSPLNDLRNVSGVKQTVRRHSPKNDLSDVRGVRRMFRQDKARNDLNDVSGVEELFNESNQSHRDAESLFDQLIGKPPIKAVYSKTFCTNTAKKKRGRKSKALHTSLDVFINNVEGWLEEELNKRLNKSKTNVSRELQKLHTETIEGTAPIRTSRVRNSTIIKANESDRKKSASEVYGAHTLPIKKRSLVEASINKSKESSRSTVLPIKKRVVVHSTPVKGKVNMTMNASVLGRVSPIAVLEQTQLMEDDASIRPNQPKQPSEERPKSRRGTKAITESKETSKAEFVKPSPKKTRGRPKATKSKPISPTKDNSPSKAVSSPKTKQNSQSTTKKSSPVKEVSPVKTKVASPMKKPSPAKANLASAESAKTTRSRRKEVVIVETNTKKRGAALVVGKKSPVMSPKPKLTRKRKEAEITSPTPKPSPKKTRAGRKQDQSKDDKPKTPKSTRAKVQKATVVVSKPSPLLKPRATRTKAQADVQINTKQTRKVEKTESPPKSQVTAKSTNKNKKSDEQTAPKTRGRKTVNESKNNTDVEKPASKAKKQRKVVEEPVAKKTRNTRQDKSNDGPAPRNTRKVIREEKSDEEPASKKTKKGDKQEKTNEEPKTRNRGKKVEAQESVQSEPTTRARRGTRADDTDVKTRKRKTTVPDSDIPVKLSKSKEVSHRGRKRTNETTHVDTVDVQNKSGAKDKVEKGQGDAPVRATRGRKTIVAEHVPSPRQKQTEPKTRGKKAKEENVSVNQKTEKRKRTTVDVPVQERSKRSVSKKSTVTSSPTNTKTRLARSNKQTAASSAAGRSRRR